MLADTFRKSPVVLGIHIDAEVNLFAENDGTSAIIGASKVSGAGVTDFNALRRTLHGHELVPTAASDLIFIDSVRLSQSFAFVPYPIPSNAAKKKKCHLDLRTCSRLDTTLGIPKQ